MDAFLFFANYTQYSDMASLFKEHILNLQLFWWEHIFSSWWIKTRPSVADSELLVLGSAITHFLQGSSEFWIHVAQPFSIQLIAIVTLELEGNKTRYSHGKNIIFSSMIIWLYQWNLLGSINGNLQNKVYILTQINSHLVQEEHKWQKKECHVKCAIINSVFSMLPWR